MKRDRKGNRNLTKDPAMERSLQCLKTSASRNPHLFTQPNRGHEFSFRILDNFTILFRRNFNTKGESSTAPSPADKVLIDKNRVITMPEFNDLETLAQEAIDLTSVSAIDARTFQYHDASLEEIVDLLEEVTEPFALLAPNLPPQLQQSAKQEIEFLTSVYQQRLAELKQDTVDTSQL